MTNENAAASVFVVSDFPPDGTSDRGDEVKQRCYEVFVQVFSVPASVCV